MTHPPKKGTPNRAHRLRLKKRVSRFRQDHCFSLMYLTDLLKGSFTVTDSPGLSPDSMCCIPQAEKSIDIELSTL